MTGLVVERKIEFGRGRRSRKTIRPPKENGGKAALPGRVPRVSRLMALAVRCEDLVSSGRVADYVREGEIYTPGINWQTGGYVKGGLPKDPWGNHYQYLNPGQHGEIDIYTLGRDGRPGGEGVDADVGNWDLE